MTTSFESASTLQNIHQVSLYPHPLSPFPGLYPKRFFYFELLVSSAHAGHKQEVEREEGREIYLGAAWLEAVPGMATFLYWRPPGPPNSSLSPLTRDCALSSPSGRAQKLSSSGLLCGLLGLLWPPHHLWLFTAYLTFCCFSRRFPICAEFSSWNNPVSVDSLPKPQSWQSRYCKAPPDSFFLRYKCLFQTKPLSSCSLS